jgi:hypothetical protein
MFNDGSVMHKWNGRTQMHRALLELAELKKLYPNDHITLAYRPAPQAPWRRVESKGQ